MMTALTNAILRYGQEGSTWQEFPLEDKEYLIGRADECDIQLQSQEVSRFHATLKVAQQGFWILDMGSTNGILIDGQRLQPNRRVAIKSEQEFIIGPFTLMVETPKLTVPVGGTMIGMKVPALYQYDVAELRRSQFAHMAGMTYLNNASAAPIPKRTLEKIQEIEGELIANAAWNIGERSFEMYRSFLSTLASFINAASPDELVVVSSRSAGINMIAQSLNLAAGDNILFCDQEHPSNAFAWMSLERDGVITRQVPAQNGGLVLEALQAEADDRTKLVAASAVQFFTGHRTDLAAIGKFCREREIIFVVDANQAVGHLPIDVQQMNIDVLVSGAHKSLMASPGVGFMYVREAVCDRLNPLLLPSMGFGKRRDQLKYNQMPRKGAIRFFMGTPHLAGMLAMLESIALIQELKREAIDIHTTNLAAQAIESARSSGYEIVTVRGEHGPIATFASGLDLEKTQALVNQLAARKVFTAVYPDLLGVPHLRLSFHCYNLREEVDSFFDELEQALGTLTA